MDDNDTYGSLVRQCQPTPSQEDRLRTCPFALEDGDFTVDESSEPNETPVELTGIIIVSLPDSSKDDSSPQEDFHTRPEESLLASSEEQRTTTAIDALAGQHINGVNDCLDGGNGGETMAIDGSCADTERTVDLGRDSNNLGFSGVKLTQGIDTDDGVSGVDHSSGADKARVSEVSEDELKKYRILLGELNEGISFESQLKKLKVSQKNSGLESPNVCLGNNEPLIAETNRNKNPGTGVLESEFEKIGEVLGLGKNTMNVDSQLKETEEGVGLGKANRMSKNGAGGSVRKNIEDLDKFKYVTSGSVNRRGGMDKGVGGRRELPSSIGGHICSSFEKIEGVFEDLCSLKFSPRSMCSTYMGIFFPNPNLQ